MANIEQYHAIGRRKTASARVFLRPGSGQITVNKKNADEYFQRDVLMMLVRQPLVLTEMGDKFDILCNVKGGGKSGQAGAIRLGIARALCEANAEHRPILKQNGLLTRDARKVERKKYGRRKARRSFQFSKR